MDARRYQRLQELFESASQLETRARESLLEQLARDDAQLADELRALLAVDGDEERMGAFADAQVDVRRERLERALLSEASSDPKVNSSLDAHPKRIAAYEIVRLAGRGGMGLVYEARQEKPSRRVALKLLDPLASSPERLRRFRLEAEVLGRLHHPGIAQIFEFDTFDIGRGPQPFFAMEYVEGVDVCSFADRAQLDVRARLELIVKLADAVQHAHERGVVHRDIKPDNVLVGDDGQPKVLDFGIAHADTTSTALSTLHTKEGQILGTLAYMAPEQLAGHAEQIGPRTDVYALGVLAFQMLAGRLPIDPSGLSPVAAVHALNMRDAPLLGAVDARFAGDIETIVAKALEKESEQRYSSAAALAADLRRHLDSFPIAAHAPSTWYRARKFARRNRALVVGASAVAFVLLAGAVASTWFAVGESRSRALATQRERIATHQAYVSAMLAASEALAAGSLDTARSYLAAAPSSIGGWERRHFAARTTRNVAEFPFEGAPLHQLLFAPALESLVGIQLDGVVRRWNADSGANTLTFQLPGLSSYAFLHADRASLSSCLLLPVQQPSEPQRHDYCEFDLRDGSLLSRWTLGRPTDQFRLFVSSADGSTLCGISVAGDIVVWDLATCAEHREPGHASCAGVAFTHDGRRLAYLEPGHVRIADVPSLAARVELDFDGELTTLAFHPDSRTLAVGQATGAVTLWDVGEDSARLLRHVQESGRISIIRWGEDGSALGVLSGSGRLHSWTASGEDLGSLYTPQLTWPRWCFVGDSSRVACAGSDLLVRVFDATLAGVASLRGHTSYVYPVAFSPDGGTLLSGGWDGADSLRAWDARTGDPIGAVGLPSSIVWRIGFGADGLRALVGVSCCGDSIGTPTRRGIAAFDLLDGTLGGEVFERAVAGGLGMGVELATDAHGDRIAAVRPDGSLSILDARDGSTQREIAVDAPFSSYMPAWSPDGKYLALAVVIPVPSMDWTQQSQVRAFDASSYAELGRWKAHDALVLGLDVRPDGTQIATASQDQSIRVWSFPTGALLAELIGHDQEVLCVRWSPDGTRIATGGRDNRVRVWDATTFEQVAVLAGHTDYVYSLAWSPDGSQLASSSGDGTVRLWETRTNSERAQAQRERREVVGRRQPEIDALLAAGNSPRAVADQLLAQMPAKSREREIVLQLVLQQAISRSKTK